MCLVMEQMGLVVEVYYYEVAIVGQNEVVIRFNIMIKKVDEIQIYKYVVYNVAYRFGKIAIFMLKSMFGDNGFGMYCYMFLFKNGVNLFVGDKYVGLFEQALYYIGGVIKYVKAINVLVNSIINFYKRLVSGYEVSVMLVYFARNRFAFIRISVVFFSKVRRIEVRFSDSVVNSYLCFVVLLMVGFDGIKNKIYSGEVMDKNLYDLSLEEAKEILQVVGFLEEVLNELDLDREFLKVGGVFIDEVIDAYIVLRREEDDRVRMISYSVEFELYYSV